MLKSGVGGIFILFPQTFRKRRPFGQEHLGTGDALLSTGRWWGTWLHEGSWGFKEGRTLTRLGVPEHS